MNVSDLRAAPFAHADSMGMPRCACAAAHNEAIDLGPCLGRTGYVHCSLYSMAVETFTMLIVENVPTSA